ncbi:MAG: DUF1292 domain-containing protein [Firmicutes bacterium]|nr:DUF1292 domain-containing protein [Bacillota bacterium]
MPVEDDIVTLVYDDGEEEDFSVVDVVEVNGNRYAILIPENVDAEADTDEEEYEEYVFRVEEGEDGEEILVDIDDDEYEQVMEALDELYEDEDEDEEGDDDYDDDEDEDEDDYEDEDER